MEKRECVDDCSKDNIYKYEYNDTCLKSCSENYGLYYNYNKTKCIDRIPDGYYLNDPNNKTIDKCNIKCRTCDFESSMNDLCLSCNIENNYYPITNNNSYIYCYNYTPSGYIFDNSVLSYNHCYSTCRECIKVGDIYNHQCSECIDNYYLSKTNCYKNCPHYYFFDELNIHHCTLDKNCPENKSKLIEEKGECVDDCSKDDIYKYEYNDKCYKDIHTKENNLTDYYVQLNISNFKDKYKINNVSNVSKLDEIINDIRVKLISGSMNSLISNIIEGDKEDLLLEDDNLLCQVTSTENQLKNKYDNISTIILGECEDILKKQYKIDKDMSLIILKIDYYQPGSLIPIIAYEVYHPTTKVKLDLTYCKDNLINFNIPVSIDENNLFKYDPNDEYYTNECYPSTTDKGTDILINDRQNEYNDNNMSICENNCTFNGYDKETKKALCECGIKTKQIVVSELINKTDLLSYNFTNVDQSSNMFAMKCYYTLFSKTGLLKNIGSYILLFTILLFLISIILFYKCGYNFLEDDIQEIMDSKEEEIKNKNININIYEIIDINANGNNNNSKNKKIKKKVKKTKKKKIKKFNHIKQKYNSNHINVGNSKNILNSKLIINKDISLQKEVIKEKDNVVGANNGDNSMNYYDLELNSLPYNGALMYDKRKFINCYISLIRTKHPLIFSFCPIKDYNSIIIKIDLFFLSFCIYSFINALFFNEKTIHQIYQDKGIYNFIYLIPYILYSFIVSHTIFTVIKYFSLSERNIYEIKKTKTIEEAFEKKEKIKRCLIIKYILFFIISLLFLLFFWYYLSSFGAVYQNTQIYLIKNILISFGFSMIYPFIINLLPALLRIYSLKDLNRESLYKLGLIMQII